MRSGTSISLNICGAIVRLASLLVPRAKRQDWTREWRGEMWHRREFFRSVEAWNLREVTRLFISCFGAFADAAWLLASHEPVRTKFYQCGRSPRTPIAGLLAAMVVMAVCTGGLPATRDLVTGREFPSGLVYVWLHPSVVSAERGLPLEVVRAWAAHSTLLTGAAAFSPQHAVVQVQKNTWRPLVIRTEPALFRVLSPRTQLGVIPEHSGVLLTDAMWRSRFHADPHVIGQEIRRGGDSFQIAGVLSSDFRFLTREPALYIVDRSLAGNSMMVVARIRPNVSREKLDRELTQIAENSCYYFFQSQLRYSFLSTERWTPLVLFATGVTLSGLLVAAVSRFRFKGVESRAAAYRAGYFVLKSSAALALVFVAGLEWSRSQSAILFGSRDPASGPFLLWLYILVSMGVWWWAVADQRARCRECLRLLCFPVRIGCPGHVLLDWSGTEFLCSQGHGVLHVPDLETSWDEPDKHWISLDQSWKDLFADVR